MDHREFDYASALVAAQNGDQTASRDLVEALYPLVIKIVRAHLPRAMAEEDLAQEIFVKMFARMQQYRGSQPFPHWVSRLAVTTCIDQLRAKQRRPELRWADLSLEQAAVLDQTLIATSDEVVPDPAEARQLVEKLLAGLDPQDRAIIHWLDLEQLSVAEIQEKTGWGASFIKVRAMRARRKMRLRLEQMDQQKENR